LPDTITTPDLTEPTTTTQTSSADPLAIAGYCLTGVAPNGAEVLKVPNATFVGYLIDSPDGPTIKTTPGRNTVRMLWVTPPGMAVPLPATARIGQADGVSATTGTHPVAATKPARRRSTGRAT